jgi:hypothetical protein
MEPWKSRTTRVSLLVAAEGSVLAGAGRRHHGESEDPCATPRGAAAAHARTRGEASALRTSWFGGRATGKKKRDKIDCVVIVVLSPTIDCYFDHAGKRVRGGPAQEKCPTRIGRQTGSISDLFMFALH